MMEKKLQFKYIFHAMHLNREKKAFKKSFDEKKKKFHYTILFFREKKIKNLRE